jgi:hypothetical protein
MRSCKRFCLVAALAFQAIACDRQAGAKSGSPATSAPSLEGAWRALTAAEAAGDGAVVWGSWASSAQAPYRAREAELKAAGVQADAASWMGGWLSDRMRDPRHRPLPETLESATIDGHSAAVRSRDAEGRSIERRFLLENGAWRVAATRR